MGVQGICSTLLFWCSTLLICSTMMAYGGPTAIAPAPVVSISSTRQVKLDKECELRIEVSADTPLRLRLLAGTAEIYGTEIPPEIWLNFPPRLKFAVFTWHGATIEIDGVTETDYTVDETPMISYVNVQAILDGRRNRAKASINDSELSQELRRSLLHQAKYHILAASTKFHILAASTKFHN